MERKPDAHDPRRLKKDAIGGEGLSQEVVERLKSWCYV